MTGRDELIGELIELLDRVDDKLLEEAGLAPPPPGAGDLEDRRLTADLLRTLTTKKLWRLLDGARRRLREPRGVFVPHEAGGDPLTLVVEHFGSEPIQVYDWPSQEGWVVVPAGAASTLSEAIALTEEAEGRRCGCGNQADPDATEADGEVLCATCLKEVALENQALARRGATGPRASDPSAR